LRRAVVVTGASSGIGASTVEVLASNGFMVYAGVRNDADAARLAGVDAEIRPLLLDVTKSESIAASVEVVEASGIPLAGIVNNAGIAIAGPLEFLPIDQLRRQFEVNLFGALAVAQAFLPRLRADRGRLVFVGSVSGRFAVPFIAPYSSSKFALRALADAMRIELAPARIHVALIEPGSVKTPIWKKGREENERFLRSLPAIALERYGAALEALARLGEREERAGIPPERVSRAILHALRARRPRAHYIVGPPARIATIFLGLLPPALHDRLIRKSMRLP
jgi:NAD(P)-dependent dehydrogenase (short-subunit alcohol dehydrogenase family)